MISSIEQSAFSEITPRAGASVPLTLTMPPREYPFARIPEHLPSHPELNALRERWSTIRGNRALPRRNDFDLGTMKRWASHLAIATVTLDGRFQFRLFGTELTRLYGRDLSGSILDDLTPRNHWSVVIMHYREAVRTRQPLFAPISVANGKWYNEVSRLLLPLTDGRDAAAFVMGADYSRHAL